MAQDHLLFVYGTLKRGGANHGYLAGQSFIAAAQTVPGFVLYELDGFPGMVRTDAGAGVTGELWSVTNPCLAELDRFEGVHEGLFHREVVSLSPPHNQTVAEAYVYSRSVAGRKSIGPTWPASSS